MIPSRYSSVDSLFWIWASKQWVNFRVSGRTQKATHILKVSLTIYVGYLLFCNYFNKFVDAFLLAIYNTEAAEQQSNRAMSTAIVNMPANPLIRPSLIKVPPLATSSTYHDSARLESEDKLDQRPSGKTNKQCLSCDLFIFGVRTFKKFASSTLHVFILPEFQVQRRIFSKS